MVNHRGRNIYLLQTFLKESGNTAMSIFSLSTGKHPQTTETGGRMNWKLRYVVVLFGNQGND